MNIKKNDPLFTEIRRLHTEDYFTHILAFILRKDKEVIREFLRLFELNIDFKKYEIFTQQNDEKTKKRPDIEIQLRTSGNVISIFIENKIDSVVYEEICEDVETKTEKIENQLERYSQIQKKRIETKEINKGFVFLLTRDYEHVEDQIYNIIFLNTHNKFKHVYWSEIYKLFNDFQPKNEVLRFLKYEFISLMESENMESFKGLKEKDLDDLKKEFFDTIEIQEKIKYNSIVTKLFDEVGKKIGTELKYAKISMRNIELQSGSELLESKILNDGKTTSLSIDYYFEHKEFYFIINKGREQLGGKNDKLEKNGYYREKPSYYLEKQFSSKKFFDLPAEQQVKELTKFCKNEIEFCKKIKLI